MDTSEVETRLLVLLNALAGTLPEAELKEMRELTEAGEPGIALENLCVQLVEFERRVPRAIRDEIGSVGGKMRIDPKYWSRLSLTDAGPAS